MKKSIKELREFYLENKKREITESILFTLLGLVTGISFFVGFIFTAPPLGIVSIFLFIFLVIIPILSSILYTMQRKKIRQEIKYEDGK